MIDIPAVMRHLRPDATWTLDGDDYDGLTMTDGSEAPAFAEIEQAWPAVQQARIDAQAAKDATKQSAIEKLAALGLTADEIKEAFGLEAPQ